MFKNDDFAWDILEEEIKLETSGIKIDGEDIARLLALYMVYNLLIRKEWRHSIL